MTDAEREKFAREFALYVHYGRDALVAMERMRAEVENLQDKIVDIDLAMKELDKLSEEIENKEYHLRDALLRVGDTSCVVGELVDDGDEGLDWVKSIPCDGKKVFVYYLLNEDKDKVKIGISANPLKRAKSIQTSSGEDIELINVIEFPNREQAREAESFLHSTFSFRRRRPSKVARSCEWFDSCIVETLKERFWTYEQLGFELGSRWNNYLETADKIAEKMGIE